jgi:hypothetical protein
MHEKENENKTLISNIYLTLFIYNLTFLVAF